MQVKCPKCPTVLKVADPTGPVKIKCPKCATVLQIGGSAKPAAPKQPAQKAAAPKPAAPKQTARKAATQRQAAPARPAQPAAPTPAPAMAPDGGFDFLDLPGPAPGQQPIRQFTQVNPPTRRVQPAPKPDADDNDDDGDGETGDAPRKKKTTNVSGMSKGTIAVLVGGVGIMMLLLVIGVVVLASSSGKSASATPKRKPPDGFEYKSVNGVSAFMPEGTEIEDLPGQMDMKVVMTDSTTYYVLGSTASNNVEMKVDKLGSRLQRLMAAGIIGGSPHERNGYKGFKFRLDQGFKLPDMEIEVFQNEGRIIVLGVSNSNMGGGDNYVVGQDSDPEMRNVFLESLEIAPPSSGWSW